MMFLGYLADRPAFMGNLVLADPKTNTIKVSHCLVPTRMAGYDQPPRRYALRDYHGTRGVTAYVELEPGGRSPWPGCRGTRTRLCWRRASF